MQLLMPTATHQQLVVPPGRPRHCSHWSRILIPLAALVLLVLAGCSGSSGGAKSGGNAPKAMLPETQFDFGNVPVTNDMRQARVKRFVIRNAGTADLRLGKPQVATLEGC